jgi:dipeptidyl-peptidase 4
VHPLEHPQFLEQYAATHRFRLGRPAAITVAPDGGSVLFLRSGARSFVRDLWSFDVEAKSERVLVTAGQLLGSEEESLSLEELARRERQRSADRGIATYALSADGRTILIPLSQKLYLFDRTARTARAISSAGGPPIDARLSPDGRSIAAVRDGDLWVHELASGLERRLTTREGPEVTYGLAEFVAQEEMSRHHGYWWSPDGVSIAVQRTDTSALERMHIADLMRPDRPPQSWPYPRAGRDNAQVRLGVVPVTGGEIRWISWDHDRYPYLATVRWERPTSLTLVVQDRAQSELCVLAADPTKGTSEVLLREHDPTWLNLDQEMPRHLGDEGFLWTSERGGSWQLELRAPDGSFRRALTDPGFGYAGLLAIDLRVRQLFVRATNEPTEMHVFRVPLDEGRGAPEKITQDRGTHGAIYGRGQEIWVHSAHTFDGRLFSRVMNGSRIVGEIPSASEAPPFIPQIELRRSADLATLVLRPRTWDRSKRHPVIVYVYGGPHVQTVLATPQDYLLQQWLADQGFVVLAFDGRGTPGRGRSFERAIHGSFASVPVEDQARALEAMLDSDPSLDRDRVGVYGWSFGGYLAGLLVLRRPDLYRAAVAGAPVTDWLDYDTHYTERYLGDPKVRPEAYEESSVLGYAPQLERPLLIIHGTSDDNVYFSHAIKLSDALFRAGRRHEFLPLAGFTHMVPDPIATKRLYEAIAGFFVRELKSGRSG